MVSNCRYMQRTPSTLPSNIAHILYSKTRRIHCSKSKRIKIMIIPGLQYSNQLFVQPNISLLINDLYQLPEAKELFQTIDAKKYWTSMGFNMAYRMPMLESIFHFWLSGFNAVPYSCCQNWPQVALNIQLLTNDLSQLPDAMQSLHPITHTHTHTIQKACNVRDKL